jgi:hypothetical protein
MPRSYSRRGAQGGVERHGRGGSGRGQLVGGRSEEVAVVSQDQRGGRNREALGWRLL